MFCGLRVRGPELVASAAATGTFLTRRMRDVPGRVLLAGVVRVGVAPNGERRESGHGGHWSHGGDSGFW
jgi:hypothetical protein